MKAIRKSTIFKLKGFLIACLVVGSISVGPTTAYAVTCGGGSGILLGTGYCLMTIVNLGPDANASWDVPLDWSNTNIVDCIGAGGAGASGTSGAGGNGGGGGGGGAFAESINLYGIRPGGTVTYHTGSPGGLLDTWFNDTSFPTLRQACGAKGGSNGGALTGGNGGSGALSYSVSSTTHSGGTGGTGVSGSGSQAGGGGGGAAGYTQNGGNASAATGGTGNGTTTAGASGAQYPDGQGFGGGGSGVAGAVGGGGGQSGGGAAGGGKTNGASSVGGNGNIGSIEVYYLPSDLTPTRKIRLFRGYRIKLIANKIKLFRR